MLCGTLHACCAARSGARKAGGCLGWVAAQRDDVVMVRMRLSGCFSSKGKRVSTMFTRPP